MSSRLIIDSFIDRNGKYFVYGLSNFGRWILQEANNKWGNESPVIGIIESNPVAERYNNVPIYSPSEILNMDSSVQIIIASFTYTNEMENTLIGLGVDPARILFFERIHPFFRSLCEEHEEGIDCICFWPPVIEKNDEYYMLISKIRWFVSENTERILFSDALEHFDEGDMKVFSVSCSREYLKDCDKIYLWNNMFFDDIEEYSDKVYSVDSDFFYTMEIGNYQFLRFYSLDRDSKTKQLEQSIENFERMHNEYASYDFADIVCNGPSIIEMKQASFFHRKSFSVFVNAAICDRELVEEICPDCLVVTDTIYLSMYEMCRLFYDELLQAWKKHHFWIVMFEHQKTIFDSHFPELASYTIGVPFSYGNEYVFPEPNDFRVSATLNVLSEMAIPIASSVCNTIRFWGCTGRKEINNSGWGHSEKSSYDQTKEVINKMWKSLFRDYQWENDYETHCRVMGELLSFGEMKGKRYINMTTSYIPCLKDRNI